jgi:predicted acyltransferase
MFIAGTAMAFSLHKQASQGMTWNQSFRKILKRCFWLFFWGVLDYAIKPEGLSFELWDVLTQLSFTTLVAFLIFRLSATTQIMICVGLLLLTEMLYRFTNVPGFDQPFTDQHNFGNYTDLLLMNKINKDGWVAINCIPTCCTYNCRSIGWKAFVNWKRKNKTIVDLGCYLSHCWLWP